MNVLYACDLYIAFTYMHFLKDEFSAHKFSVQMDSKKIGKFVVI